MQRDNYGPYHVRGTAGDGKDGWDVQVWMKGSDQDGPGDHRFRVINRSVIDYALEPAEQEAVFALIDQWEEQLPLMVASPIRPPL